MEWILTAAAVIGLVLASPMLLDIAVNLSHNANTRRYLKKLITDRERWYRQNYPEGRSEADMKAYLLKFIPQDLPKETREKFRDVLYELTRQFKLAGLTFLTFEEEEMKLKPPNTYNTVNKHPDWHDYEKDVERFQKPIVRQRWEECMRDVVGALAHHLKAPPQAPSTIRINVGTSWPAQQTIDTLQPILSKFGYTSGHYPYDTLTTYKLDSTKFNPKSALNLLSDIPIPLDVPEHIRFEHMWVVAPPGTGKSNLLSHFIMGDLDKVARGEASVIVMESKTDLIKGLRGLKRFEEDLKDRLVIIDAEDVEYPVALNLFDIGGSTDNLSPRDRAAYRNATISMLNYVFRSLLDMSLTPLQSTLLTNSILLLLNHKGANLDTVFELMQSKNVAADFADALAKCSDDTRRYFTGKFNDTKDPFIGGTKSQIIDRIHAIKSNQELAAMFSAKETRINLFDEMGKGKVILINAPKDLLQEEGVELFSRFFLAMILLAAQKRATLPQHQRLPVYVFIDEAQDVIRRDERLPVLLDQARGFRVSMTVAHQRLDQMTPPVLDALYGSTAIKLAARVPDANALARNMQTTPEFILKQPQYCFAAHVRGITGAAGTFKALPADFSKMPQLEDPDAIRDQMRRDYACVPEPPPEQPSPSHPPDDDPTKAAPWPKA